MRKILLLVCGLVCTSCNRVMETFNVSNDNKFVISAIEQQDEVYLYHLNREGHKKFLWDEYGYTSAEQYNIGDTLIVKIELYNK